MKAGERNVGSPYYKEKNVRKITLVLACIIFHLILPLLLHAQTGQTVTNGAQTAPINFPGSCTYTWTNSDPSIGLPASGTGNIPAFTAVNTGNTPVTATITATSPPAGLAYIANNSGQSNSVSVIDIATNKVTATVSVGYNPAGVAVNHAGTFAYIGNQGGNGSISVINTVTNVVSATIALNGSVGEMVLSPDDSKLYVANYPYVTVINTSNNSIITNFTEGNNFVETGLAISPDGSRLYISDGTDNDILVVNAADYTTIADIIVGYNPYGIVLSPDGSRLYAPTGIGTITDPPNGNLNIINIVNGTILATIPVGQEPSNVVLSIDGSRAYVSNGLSNSVTVINTVNFQVVATIVVGNGPFGLSSTSDGSEIFVTNNRSNNVSVINTATNTVTATIATGQDPASYGNFITPGLNCGGPVTFTITVNPTVPVPTITATTPTGSISACQGTASASPNLQQFNVSGTNLTGDITVIVPSGFQVSLSYDGIYSNSLTLAQSNGTVTGSLIYVRSSATELPGNNTGIITLNSPGAVYQPVTVNSTVYAIPTANIPGSQIVVNGMATAPVHFTGTANSYTWVNNTPGIGLAASGTGDIASFIAVNNTAGPIVAVITETPVNGAGCDGSPGEFTITIEPTPAVLTVAGALSPLTTIYGTPSPAESFTVSCNTINAQILVTPPAGFEASGDGVTFNATATVTSTQSNSAITVYVRLAAATQVGGYSGNITLSTSNAPGANVEIPVSTVTPAPLTVTADNKTRPFDSDNPVLTVTYTGFVNNDGPEQFTVQPAITTTATTQSAVGQYPILVSGAVSTNYTFIYVPGILTITPSLSATSIPNTFTPNGDGINDTWYIKGLEYYPKSTVNIFNRWGQQLFSSIGYPNPWDGTYHGKTLPSGTYYYIIDPKNGQAVIAGSVAIIR